MAKKSRRSVKPSSRTYVVQVSDGFMKRIPASELRRLKPHGQTVADLITAMLTRAVVRGMRIYAQQRRTRRKEKRDGVR